MDLTFTNAMRKELCLPLEQYCVSHIADLDDLKGIHGDNLSVAVQYSLEHMAHILRLSLKAPTYPLQKDEIVATWPATWWDHVKERLGWKHQRKELRINQCLVIPDIPIPLAKHNVRMWYSTRETLNPPPPDTD